MKIIFATYQSAMFIRGGPYVVVTETGKGLKELGVEVEYFNMWEKPLEIFDCDLIHLVAANFAVYHLARSLVERKIRFVNTPIFFTRRSASTIRKICKIDKTTRKFLRGLWWDYGMIRDICHWSEIVLPNTADEGKLISAGMDVPESKIEVIPNGVSKNFLYGDPEIFIKKYGIKNFILNVGHIGPERKNTLNLIKALGKIDHPAVIIGRITAGGEAEEVLKEAEKNKNVLIIDGIAHNDPLLASAYAACDVFVLPSQFETPGIAALEAALAGAKIVITPHGGTREYFGGKADYVDPYSVGSIKEGIEKALNKSKNDDLKNFITDNFLWDKIAEKTLSVYQKVLNSK